MMVVRRRVCKKPETDLPAPTWVRALVERTTIAIAARRGISTIAMLHFARANGGRSVREARLELAETMFAAYPHRHALARVIGIEYSTMLRWLKRAARARMRAA